MCVFGVFWGFFLCVCIIPFNMRNDDHVMYKHQKYKSICCIHVFILSVDYGVRICVPGSAQ